MRSTAFTLIAHRGLSSRAPENTFAAFDLALKAGFTNIELDVQLTSDGIPIVIHDATLERTTNGQGPVSHYTLEDIQKLDAGSWFNESFSKQRTASLEEVLIRYDDKAHLHVELKSLEPELPFIVSQVIKKLGWNYWDKTSAFNVPGITITSFHFEQLERSVKNLGNLPHHWLTDSITGRSVARVLKVGVTGICPNAAKVNEGEVALAHMNGLTARGWGVGNLNDLKRLHQAGADGATVNWLDQAANMLSVSK
jgi:glycerophosphoryl diester phosphodiesterase